MVVEVLDNLICSFLEKKVMYNGTYHAAIVTCKYTCILYPLNILQKNVNFTTQITNYTINKPWFTTSGFLRKTKQIHRYIVSTTRNFQGYKKQHETV